MSLTGGITDWQAGEVMAWLSDRPAFASLHVSSPVVGDPLASEVDDLLYARPQVMWGPKSARCLVNTNQLLWPRLDPTGLTHVGVFDSRIGGRLRMSLPLPTPLASQAFTRFEIGAGNLFLLWP